MGGLVASIFRKHKNMRAGILDIAKVIDVAETNFHMPNGQYADVGDRVSSQHLIIGDFLVKIPKFEVYTMKWYVHNWDDTKVLTVLTNIRKSIIWGPKSGLVVLESLLSDGRMGRLMSNTDMTMMVSANGQEKYNLEWRALAKKLDGKSTRSIIYATLGFVQSKRYQSGTTPPTTTTITITTTTVAAYTKLMVRAKLLRVLQKDQHFLVEKMALITRTALRQMVALTQTRKKIFNPRTPIHLKR